MSIADTHGGRGERREGEGVRIEACVENSRIIVPCLLIRHAAVTIRSAL